MTYSAMIRRLLILSFLVISTACGQSLTEKRQLVEKRVAEFNIEAHFDQNYADNNNPKQALDLFVPKQRSADKPLPVLIFIHGGGWIQGDRIDAGIHLCNVVANKGYAVASIGYRLAPEAHWPEQIYDCKAAVRWLRGHAKEYNLDPNRIAAWGNSAGAHLVSLLGTTGGVKDLEGAIGSYLSESSRVSCVINMCGPMDLTEILMTDKEGKPIPVEDPAVVALLGGPLKERTEAAKQASPVNYITSDDAPFLTAHGTRDERVAYLHATLIDAALDKAGVSSLLIPMTDSGHGINSPELIQRLVSFLDRHLADSTVEVSDTPIPLGK